MEEATTYKSLTDFVKLKRERKILEMTLQKLMMEQIPRDSKAMSYNAIISKNTNINFESAERIFEKMQKVIDELNAIYEKFYDVELDFVRSIYKIKDSEYRSFISLKYYHEKTPKEICKFMKIGRTKYYEIDSKIKQNIIEKV